MADSIGQILMLLPVILLALTLHELGHAWVAERCGDSTARLAGRMTLNPLAHIDILGLIMIFVIRFGWAKPVPVNPANLRNPRRDMILVAAAGPAANLILAFLSALAVRLMFELFGESQFLYGGQGQGVITLLQYSVLLNLYLMVFNLLPIPPLDGSRVLGNLLPYRQLVVYERYAAHGPLILFGLVMLGNFARVPILSMVMEPPVRLIRTGLFAIVGL